MSASLVGLVPLLAATLAAAAPVGPIEWSGDGRWIAYTLVESSDAPTLPSQWLLFGASPDEAAVHPFRRVHRIWTSRVKGMESVLIEESPHPCTSPAWGSDGRSLIYGRFVSADGDGPGPRRGRYELVIRSGLSQSRILVVASDLELDQESRDAMPSGKPAVSKDGRRIAIPQPDPQGGFWLVHTDESRKPGLIKEGKSPVWSPDGRQLAYFRPASVPGQEPRIAVHLMSPTGGAGRLLNFDPVLTPSLLAWTRDGQGVLAISNPMRGMFRNNQLDLIRLPSDGGPAFRLTLLEAVAPNNGPRRSPALGVQEETSRPPKLQVELTMDAEQNQGVSLIETDGSEQMMKWWDLQSQNTLKRFHPLDAGLRIGAPSLAPVGPTIAFRIDDSSGAGLVALMDLNSEEITLVAPDASTRRRWLDRLAACALDHLQTWLPDPPEAGLRPTVLPILGEMGGFHPRPYQLKRLAKFASGPLLDAAEPGDGLDEFRLFFAYLRQDFQAAESALPAVEAQARNPQERLQWLGLRAQILLSRGESVRSQGLIDFLNRTTREPTVTLEEDGIGLTLKSTPSQARIWVDHLERKRADGSVERGRAPSLDLNGGPEAESNAGAWDMGLPNLPFAPRPGPAPVDPLRIDGPPPIIRHPDNFNPPFPRLAPQAERALPRLRVLPLEFEQE